jgi:hypothetical protein
MSDMHDSPTVSDLSRSAMDIDEPIVESPKLRELLDRPLSKSVLILLKEILANPCDSDAADCAKDVSSLLPDLEGVKYRKKEVTEELISGLSGLELPNNPTVRILFNSFYEKLEDLTDYLRFPDDGLAVSKAFAAKFQGKGVEHLFRQLSEYAVAWRKPNCEYYCPMAAFLNASMTGKSRVASELVNKGVFVFLICLRPTQNENYRPVRTPHIADWATQKEVDELKFTAESCEFHYQCVVQLEHWLQLQQATDQVQLAQSWFERQSQPDFWCTMIRLIKAAQVGSFETTDDTQVKKCLKIIALKKSKLGKAVKKLRDRFEVKKISVNNNHLHLLSIIDEARQLNVASESADRFGLYRRTMQCLPQVEGFAINWFFLLTDTTSKISNLTPTSDVDFSFRIRTIHQETRSRLFPPLTMVNEMDVWWLAGKDTYLPKGASPEYSLWKLRSSLVGAVIGDESPEGIIERTMTDSIQTEVTQLRKMVSNRLLESFEFQAMFGRASFYPFFRYRRGENSEAAIDALFTLMETKLLCQFPNQEPAACSK